MVKKRRRGTAIVQFREGILVTAGRNKVFLLPGGGANRGESRMEATMRELREETGLKPYAARYLFEYKGRLHKSNGHGYFQDHHSVFLVEAIGTPRAQREIKHIGFYRPGCALRISGGTQDVIDRYYGL